MDISESVIDATRKHLDPQVFDKQGDKYALRPDVTTFIQDIIRTIHNDIVVINGYFIKGSILSFQWLDNTDIDILIEVDEGFNEEDRREIQNEVDERFSIDIPGTEHPLQIYINPGKYDYGNADGIYQLDAGWIKGPYNIRVDIDNYMDKFHKVVGSIDVSTGALRRFIIDYGILYKLPTDEIDGLTQRVQEKLTDIDQGVKRIVSHYKHIRDMRHNVFRQNVTPADIAAYGTKNALPGNVIFKLLERYYYLRFMRELQSIVENNSINSDDDVEQVKDALENSIE